MTRIMTIGLVLLVLGVAGAAQAQNIDCSGGCTDRKYGLGLDLFYYEDQAQRTFLPEDYSGTYFLLRGEPNNPLAPFSECARTAETRPMYGQVILREQDGCVPDSVADGSGCLVEIPIPTDPNDPAERSGMIQITRVSAAFGPLGLLFIRQAVFADYEGSVGERVLIGGGPETKIVWDDGGPADPLPLARSGDGGLNCCQSSTGVICQLSNLNEYPLLAPGVDPILVRRITPDWLFDGGAGTNWRMDPNHTVPGQQRGRCKVNTSRPCCIGGEPPCDNPCPGLGDVCDLRDLGLRVGTRALLPDGNPDPQDCEQGPFYHRGFLNEHCWLKAEYAVSGDPLEGCLLTNFGVHPRPDDDCDGVDDVIPDLCPGHAERDPYIDSNGDGIGDECTCGDTFTVTDSNYSLPFLRQDGILTFGDALAIVQFVQGTPGVADPRVSDTNGNSILSFGDAINVVQGVQTIQDPTTFTCQRNP